MKINNDLKRNEENNKTSGNSSVSSGLEEIAQTSWRDAQKAHPQPASSWITPLPHRLALRRLAGLISANGGARRHRTQASALPTRSASIWRAQNKRRRRRLARSSQQRLEEQAARGGGAGISIKHHRGDGGLYKRAVRRRRANGRPRHINRMGISRSAPLFASSSRACIALKIIERASRAHLSNKQAAARRITSAALKSHRRGAYLAKKCHSGNVRTRRRAHLRKRQANRSAHNKGANKIAP